MKKLMFMLAAIACAVTLQAAQLDWSLAAKSVKSPTNSSVNLEGQTTYLLTFASSAAADTLYTQLTSGAKTLTEATGMAIASAVGATGSKKAGQIADSSGNPITVTHSSLTEGGTVYAALLIVSGDKFILSSAASGMAYDPTGSVETEGNAVKFGSTHFSTTADSRTGWSTAGVPEPTSGILMLVGLGALALRRRKA